MLNSGKNYMLLEKVSVRSYLRTLTLLFSSLGLFCTLSTTPGSFTGTGGSETVNTFAILVLDENNNPCPNTPVRFVENNTWLKKVARNENVLHFAINTDINGIAQIPLDSVKSSKYNILAKHNDCSGFFETYKFLAKSDGTIQDTLFLSSSRKYSGYVLLNNNIQFGKTTNPTDIATKYILLQGTDIIQEIAPNSSIEMNALPRGTFQLVALLSSSDPTKRKISSAGTLDVSTQNQSMNISTDFNRILIDNFNDGDRFGCIYNILNADQTITKKFNEWYIVHSDSINVTFPKDRDPGNTKYIPLESAIIPSTASLMKSLHLEYTITTTTLYLIMSNKIGFPEIGFSNVDTFSFHAKGPATVIVRLQGEENNDKPQALYTVAIDSVWREYKIAFNQFSIVDPTDSKATWQTVRNRLYWFGFMADGKGSQKLSIDEVALNGCTLEDLLVK
jgi:hypothetical protein